MQVDSAQKTVLLSEVAAKKDEFMATAKAGDVVAGKVSQLIDFGAFVDITFPDGELHGVEVSLAATFDCLCADIRAPGGGD